MYISTWEARTRKELSITIWGVENSTHLLPGQLGLEPIRRLETVYFLQLSVPHDLSTCGRDSLVRTLLYL